MITLRNVKMHPDMSEETDCFSATIYVGTKRAGTVSNNGHGGCNNYHWEDRQLGQQIEAWAATQPTEFDFEKLDQLVSDLLTRVEVEQQIKRWVKKGTYFRLKGDKAGEWRTLNVKGGRIAPFDAQAKAYLVKSYGDKLECIANEDFAKAVDLSMPAKEPVE